MLFVYAVALLYVVRAECFASLGELTIARTIGRLRGVVPFRFLPHGNAGSPDCSIVKQGEQWSATD
jgi:hypothetical protein